MGRAVASQSQRCPCRRGWSQQGTPGATEERPGGFGSGVTRGGGRDERCFCADRLLTACARGEGALASPTCCDRCLRSPGTSCRGGQGGGPRPRPREAWGPAGPSLIEGLSSQLPQRRRFVPGDSALFSRVAGFPRCGGLCGVARPSSAFWSRPATVALCTFISVLTDGGVSGGKGPGQGRGPRRTGGGVARGPLAAGAANGRSSSAIRSHLSFVL